MGKSQGIGFGRCIYSLGVHNFQESQVHVDIVIQIRIFNKRIVDVIIVPDDRGPVVDQTSFVFKFRRSAVGTAYGLSGPAALDLIFQNILPYGNGFGVIQYGRVPGT